MRSATGQERTGPAGELAERHTRLDDVWGADATRLRERLGEEPSLERRLDLFEAFLVARLPRIRGVNPAVADALASLPDRPIGSVVERGVSPAAFRAMRLAEPNHVPIDAARALSRRAG